MNKKLLTKKKKDSNIWLDRSICNILFSYEYSKSSINTCPEQEQNENKTHWDKDPIPPVLAGQCLRWRPMAA